MDAGGSLDCTAGGRKGFAQRLPDLLISLFAAFRSILQRKIRLDEPGIGIDDLEGLAAWIGDPHDDELVKISARPLQYFTSFSRNGTFSAEPIHFEAGGMTLPAREIEEIFRMEPLEGD